MYTALLSVLFFHLKIETAMGSEQISKFQKGPDGQLELLVKAKKREPASIPKLQNPTVPPRDIQCDLAEDQAKSSTSASRSSTLPMGACRIDSQPKANSRK